MIIPSAEKNSLILEGVIIYCISNYIRFLIVTVLVYDLLERDASVLNILGRAYIGAFLPTPCKSIRIASKEASEFTKYIFCEALDTNPMSL